MIAQLQSGEAFVFGSNLVGEHAGGAAKQAFEQFGAAWGVGEGLTGQCYALPTLDENMQRFKQLELHSIVEAFKRCARAHPDKTFLLTKVGCGIAGYPEEYIKKFFADMPSNVIKPEGW